MTVKHLLSLAELSSAELSQLVERGIAIASEGNSGSKPLEGKIVGLYFRGPSTRTRTSFAVAAMRLGAGTIIYGPNDLQISTGETIEDSALVLSGFLDALVIRTNQSIAEMNAFAVQNRMAVINAMSDNEHPTQAIADLISIREEFGRLNDLHVLYLGEGNNTAAALALAIAKTPGMRLTVVTPEGYGLPENDVAVIAALARSNGSVVEQHHCLDELPRNVDVVYTARWQTMGEPKAEANWREKFDPYRVSQELMNRVSKPSGTIFLHDLPAVRGVEVDDEVLDGPQSRAFRQAEHKLTGAMVVLEWCLKGARVAQPSEALEDKQSMPRLQEHDWSAPAGLNMSVANSQVRISGFIFSSPIT
jgi:ornithine carbamoyltransferase